MLSGEITFSSLFRSFHLLISSSISTFEQFNMTHTVHKIRFGDEFPGNKNQLDGENRVIADGYGMYQYYFKVRLELKIKLNCVCVCDLFCFSFVSI